jgi:hypothetical protein
VNPYQDVIDWLRSPEGSGWSERRMQEAAYNAALQPGALSWHLNRSDRLIGQYPLYMAGVLSVKDDMTGEPSSVQLFEGSSSE